MKKQFFCLLLVISAFSVSIGYGQEVKIKVIVRDDNKQPLGGSSVSVSYESQKRIPKEADGRLMLQVLSFDKALLKVQKKGYAIKEITQNPANKEWEVTMWKGKEYTGLLTDENAIPMKDVVVVFQEDSYEEKSVTDNKGKFSFFAPKNVELTNSSYFEVKGEKIMPENIKIEAMGLVKLVFGKIKKQEIEKKQAEGKKESISQKQTPIPTPKKDGVLSEKSRNQIMFDKIITQIKSEKTYISSQNEEISKLIEQLAQPLKENAAIDEKQKQEIQDDLSVIRDNLVENEKVYERTQEKNRLLINHLTLLIAQKDSLESVVLLAIEKLDSTNVVREKLEIYNTFAVQENQRIKMFFGLIALFLLLLSVSFFLFGKREKKKNKELAQKNHEIEQQSKAIQKFDTELRQINNELEDHQQKLKATNELLENQNQEILKQNAIIQAQKLRTETFAQQLEREVDKKTYQLQAMLNKTTKQNEDLKQFSYIISHNIRAPIAHLLGLVSIFNRQEPNDPFNIKVLDHLHTASQNLDTVIRDLTQIISIRSELNREKGNVNIAEIIAMEKSMLKSELENSKAIFIEDISEDCEIISIKSYTQSVIHNLLSNAIKYKARSRQLEITIKVYRSEPFLCLSIQDNGIGMEINAANKERLFGLYQRMHNHVEGKGLGLYMVKTQVDALNGKVEVESIVDKGSTFTIYFPKES